MLNAVSFFIILQIILLGFMALHDWVHVPPLTNIPDLKKSHSFKDRLLTALVNAGFVLIPLILTVQYRSHFPRQVLLIITIFYSILTLGTLCAWWVPYIFGSSQKHKQAFIEYRNTHHFLPARGDNVVPNTLHVILHLQVWACLALTIYFWL
ncbi:hypothetical protein K2X40_05510 [Candidatus Babeliales bacterium]|nr:hypothetical protein [Candidatus Babeliales bacterium]